MSLLQSLLQERGIFDPFRGFLFDSGEAPVDWKETKTTHIFYFDLPGLTKEDVKLELHEGRALHVSAEGEEPDDGEKGEKWHCRERAGRGGFRREIRLPENANVEEIKAVMRDGVLVVTVPKDERKKKSRQHKKVEIEGDEGNASYSKGLGRFVCCKA